MLNAVRYGKAGRAEDSKGQRTSWRELYSSSEDLLTASVFERLSYLPARHFIAVLDATFKLDLPFLHDPQITQMQFWPRYAYSGDERDTVEPDAVFRIEDKSTNMELDVIVEVKPAAKGSGQDITQWRREITAFLEGTAEDYGVARNGLVFLALGGLGHNASGRTSVMKTEFGGMDEVRIFGSDWLNLRHCIQSLRGRSGCPDALVGDMLASLDLAGHRDWKLMNGLETIAFDDISRSLRAMASQLREGDKDDR